MKALIVNKLSDDFSGCELTEIAPPPLKEGQARIKIFAATLGFPDLLMTQGRYQYKPELPFVLGTEMAGEIVAIAGNAQDFAVGDRIVTGGLVAANTGGFAALVNKPITQLRKIPDRLSFAEAAATGSAYLTAYVSLVRRGHLQSEEWLLVHGGGGGVGLAAVDLGVQLGANVIATASTEEKCAFLQERFNLQAVLNVSAGFRERVKEITDGQGANVIYDPVGGDIFDESIRCIAWGGRLLVVGFASGRIPSVPANMPLIKGFSVVGVRAGEFGRRDPQRGAENQEAIWKLAATGKIRPYVFQTVPLRNWRDAFAMMQSRQVIGRVVLNPQEA